MPTIRSLARRVPFLRGIRAGWRILKQKIPRTRSQKLARRLAAVEAELSAMRRSVDLVDLNGYMLYMHVTDMPYHWLPTHARKGLRLTRDEIQNLRGGNGPVEDPVAAYRGYGQGYYGLDPLDLVFLHYWVHDLNFAYFDVGANIGLTTIQAARVIKRFGRKNRVVCFEPGPTADLLPWNLEVNGVDDLATFEHQAVCDFSLSEIFAGELNHSEHYRCVNRNPATEGSSHLVRTTTIDDYVERREIAGHLIVKIDTEGGEYRVWQGMPDVLSRRYTTIKLEFTPSLLSSSVDPQVFLRQMMATHYLLDIPDGETGGRFRRLREHEAAAFAAEIARRPPCWTDLLAIPKNLPGIDGLLAKFARTEP